jgi:hypothetical protein
MSDWSNTNPAPLGWTLTLNGVLQWGEGDPVDPATLFGPQLQPIRDRVAELGYFRTVADAQDAVNAIEEAQGLPPMAFVQVVTERASRNRTMGRHGQRVACGISILFAIASDRAAGDTGDMAEQLRKAIIAKMIAWTPPGAAEALDYDRYLVRSIANGLYWGEVVFATSYLLNA